MSAQVQKSSWPYSSGKELVEAGYLFVNKSRCRGSNCKAEVEWWLTPRKKYIPLDPGTMQPHWATCPDHKVFRTEGEGN